MERTTPAGVFKGAGLGSLALAAALAVGPMTASLRGAEDPKAPKPAEAVKKPAEAAKPEAAKTPEAKRVPAAVPAPTPEQQQQQEQERKAAATLNEAKQAYEQKNYGQSVAKYKEFLAQFPKRPEAMAARYGLAMALAEMPDRDWSLLVAELQTVVASPDVPEKGRAHYWLGVGLLVTGEQQLQQVQKPAEQKDLLTKATARLAQAGAELATASAALAGSTTTAELAARAKAEGAEAYVKAGRNKEAVELAKAFESDAALVKSPDRAAGLVALGKARVAMGNFPGAFGALAQVAPFTELGTGLEARYLLGRILQETGEKPEAVVQYDAVSKGFMEQRRKAEEALRNKDAWRGKPVEAARLLELTRGTPEWVAMAAYHAGTILLDYGQAAEAAPKFASFAAAMPRSELAPLAQLRQGMALVQSKQPAEATRVLSGLLEHPTLGDQATWWMGKLQRAVADPANPAQVKQQAQAAIVNFGRAGEKAAVLGKTDPAAAARRADILLDIGDAYVSIKQYKEAATPFKLVADDASNPERAEIAHERWAMVLSRQGDFAGSDVACTSFLQKYPRSMLRPSVMFWQAENSYRQGLELAKRPDGAEQAKQLQERAAQQFQAVVDRYPEFAQASAARFGLGMAYYRQAAWEKAGKQFERILDADRVGDLAAASYYQADCLVHTMPENADDALSAARLSGQLEEASKLLSAFVGTNDNRPEMPDAMLKLADCYQRNASILADQQEKAKALQSARETYDQLLTRYPKHPAFAAAVRDRARCMAATGDPQAAINELNRFRNDAKLAKSEVAPDALIRLSELMVRHGRAVDAAAMLEKARKDYEEDLAKDPSKAGLVAGLRYQHGLALKESGKLKEALAIFEGVAKDFADRPEAAEASLASIQVKKDEALGKLKAARQALAQTPADKPVDEKVLADQAAAVKQVAEIAAAFGTHADRIAENSAGSDLHVRTLRDAAASWRAIADTEIDAIRRERAAESLKKLKEKLAKDPQVGKSNSVPRPPQIRLAQVPVQPAEQKAREFYNKALEAGPDSPVCNELRLELAQMYYDRGEADPAIQLLTAAIDKNPPLELQNQLRIKLGNAYLLKKDADGALNQALQALADTNSPLRPAAYLVKGKALAMKKSWAEAITVLQRYRGGAEKYVNAGKVTEEGLLRLAEAYASAGSWEESRATYEHLLSRFPNSHWTPEARFGMGWALQNSKQFDRAVEAYADVTRRTSSDLAARAQMQIGLCRAEQKRWQDAVNELLVVPGTYDYAEWAANASLEAGKALVELKQPQQAKDVLQRVVRDHPGTEWAQLAQKRIAEIQ